MTPKRCYTFLRSYDLIPAKYQADFRNDMRVAFGGCTNAAFYNRMKRGRPIPNVEEYEEMMAVFKKYGIEKKFDDEHDF